MNDPHVAALHYRFATDPSLPKYENAPPVTLNDQTFELKLRDDIAVAGQVPFLL